MSTFDSKIPRDHRTYSFLFENDYRFRDHVPYRRPGILCLQLIWFRCRLFTRPVGAGLRIPLKFFETV